MAAGEGRERKSWKQEGAAWWLAEPQSFHFPSSNLFSLSWCEEQTNMRRESNTGWSTLSKQWIWAWQKQRTAHTHACHSHRKKHPILCPVDLFRLVLNLLPLWPAAPTVLVYKNLVLSVWLVAQKVVPARFCVRMCKFVCERERELQCSIIDSSLVFSSPRNWLTRNDKGWCRCIPRGESWCRCPSLSVSERSAYMQEFPWESNEQHSQEAAVSLQKETSFPHSLTPPTPPILLFSFHLLTPTKIDCLNLAHLCHLLSADRNRF